MHKIKPSKWKGVRLLKMARLLSFAKEDRKDFEALWILYRLTDRPDGKNVKTSIRLEDQFRKHSEEGGSIKLSLCPGCGQRIAVHEDLRTIAKSVDFLLEREEFDYLKASLDKWQAIPPELKRHFAAIQDKLDECKEKPAEEWMESIKKRDEALIG